MPKGGAFTNQIQTEWVRCNCLKNNFILLVKQLYTAGPVPWNGANDLADGKP